MSRRFITPEAAAEMREFRSRGLAIEAIADELGFSKSAVHRAVEDMPVDRRLSPDPRLPKRPKWFDRAEKLKAAGLSRFAIADALKIPKSIVYRAFDKFG